MLGSKSQNRMSPEGDMRLGVMWPPGERPGVMRPGVRPSASKSKSGAYDTCNRDRQVASSVYPFTKALQGRTTACLVLNTRSTVVRKQPAGTWRPVPMRPAQHCQAADGMQLTRGGCTAQLVHDADSHTPMHLQHANAHARGREAVSTQLDGYWG